MSAKVFKQNQTTKVFHVTDNECYVDTRQSLWLKPMTYFLFVAIDVNQLHKRTVPSDPADTMKPPS
eukprot:m.56296 g.56296  ORF g.56296 m.56296 type:complete len:66 (-) comp11553_c0_seq1:1948-2145(-)